MAITFPVRGGGTNGNPVQAASNTYVTGQPIAVCIAGATATGVTMTSVTDNGGVGNVYTATSQTPITDATDGYRIWFFTCLNPTGFTGVISGNYTGSPSYIFIAAGQALGFTGTPTIDGETNNQSSTSSIPDPGSEALTYQNNLILEGSIVAGSDATGSGYFSWVNRDGNECQYKVVTDGTWGASAFGGSAQANWLCQAVTIADVVGGGGGGTVIAGVGRRLQTIIHLQG